ncbi:MAG: Hpt domain-containing protein, partial [Acidimicrobiales bacterium]
MDEIVGEFVIESLEMLDELDQALLSLEESPEDQEVLEGIFRVLHTIKGSCGFLGFDRLQRVSHAGENLLSMLREGSLTVDEAITDALLATVDAIRESLGHIENTGEDAELDITDLVAELDRLRGAGSTAEDPQPEEATAEPEEAEAAEPPEQAELPVFGGPPRIGEVLTVEGLADPTDVEIAAREQEFGDPRRLGEILVEQGKIVKTELNDALVKQDVARGGSASEGTIRVDVSLLDDLMNLVGELVLARNQILQHTASIEDAQYGATSQRLNLITTELQEGVMKTRMQPIG